MVRWPSAYAALARAIQLLPPRSRVRRALLRHNALSGWRAWVRGDLDLMVVRFAPDFHYDPPPEWLIAGMPTVYRGHAGIREWSADLREAWEFLDHTPPRSLTPATRPPSSARSGCALVPAESSSTRASARSSGSSEA